jgi:hypothetical protein
MTLSVSTQGNPTTAGSERRTLRNMSVRREAISGAWSRILPRLPEWFGRTIVPGTLTNAAANARKGPAQNHRRTVGELYTCRPGAQLMRKTNNR